MADSINQISHGDCISGMNSLEPGSIDLAFADPPFNIGYDYDVYQDRKQAEEYLGWSRRWIAAVHRVLKDNGTFWLAIGDEYAAELKLESQKIGFHCRSWVVWYYTFGVNCKFKFTRSHAHLFYFVKNPQDFVFLSEEPENRIPSARQLVYNDNRANPKGRLPDDTWIIRPEDADGELTAGSAASFELPPFAADDTRTFTLRPQDLEGCFSQSEDSWYFPRVAGTFKERAGFHGCQMPEQLLGRIIRACSREGDVVLDPFSGSGTTLAVAKKLGRRLLGFDLSAEYVRQGTSRLESIRVGDPLDGSAEPLLSAPPTNATPEDRKRLARKWRKDGGNAAEAQAEIRQREKLLKLTQAGVLQAFEQIHDGHAADRVVADPELNGRFVQCCRGQGLAGDPRTWNQILFQLRKAGRLAHVPSEKRTSFSWEQCDPYLFAAEIAWKKILDVQRAGSLDELLCDPLIAAEFDDIARSYAPGYTSLQYRWAALKLRKQAKSARVRSEVLKPPARLGKLLSINDLQGHCLPDHPGVYILRLGKSFPLYVGETLNLQARLRQQFAGSLAAHWRDEYGDIGVQLFPTQTSPSDLLAWQCRFVTKYAPQLNVPDFRS